MVNSLVNEQTDMKIASPIEDTTRRLPVYPDPSIQIEVDPDIPTAQGENSLDYRSDTVNLKLHLN